MTTREKLRIALIFAGIAFSCYGLAVVFARKGAVLTDSGFHEYNESGSYALGAIPKEIGWLFIAAGVIALLSSSMAKEK